MITYPIMEKKKRNKLNKFDIMVIIDGNKYFTPEEVYSSFIKEGVTERIFKKHLKNLNIPEEDIKLVVQRVFHPQ